MTLLYNTTRGKYYPASFTQLHDKNSTQNYCIKSFHDAKVLALFAMQTWKSNRVIHSTLLRINRKCIFTTFYWIPCRIYSQTKSILIFKICLKTLSNFWSSQNLHLDWFAYKCYEKSTLVDREVLQIYGFYNLLAN